MPLNKGNTLILTPMKEKPQERIFGKQHRSQACANSQTTEGGERNHPQLDLHGP